MAENAIYKIRNLLNGKFYVGSAVKTRERFRQHRKLLRKGTHHCKHLQAAWSKCGEELFVFEVIERVESHDLLEAAEDRWLVEHVGKPHCYNSGRSAKAPWRGTKGTGLSPMTGTTISEERKQHLREVALEQWKTSDPRTGQVHSEEARAKISAKVQKAVAEGRGGRFIPSTETRAKMSAALKGNQCAKGYKRTPAEIEAIRQRTLGNQNWLGKSHSMESRIKMGRAVIATAPDGAETRYDTITLLRAELDLLAPTINRALKANKPLTKGPYKGWSFRYT